MTAAMEMDLEAVLTVRGAEKRYGAGGRTVTGEPLELVLWTSGRRDLARVTVD